MILTGKAKEDFLNWVNLTEDMFLCAYSEREITSLIVDWFDSVGIYIAIKKSVDIFWLYNIKINSTGVYISALELMQKTRQQATEQAIIKANDIYNEKEA